MDIAALNGQFSVAMMRHGDWHYEWDDKGKTLSFWGKSPLPLSVMTNRGDFIEVEDENGRIIDQGGDGSFFHVMVRKERTTLRFKKLPNPALTAGQIDKARQIVTRYLISDKPYNCGLPDTFEGVIAWMKTKFAKIPKSARAKASFRFDTTMEYGETYPNIEITYSEPETDKEVIERVKIERERSRLRDAADHAQLERLQAKFAK